jgi:hypothetical protein
MPLARRLNPIDLILGLRKNVMSHSHECVGVKEVHPRSPIHGDFSQFEACLSGENCVLYAAHHSADSVNVDRLGKDNDQFGRAFIRHFLFSDFRHIRRVS